MNNDPGLRAIANLFEQNRNALPKDFEELANRALGDIAAGSSPRIAITRGGKKTISPKLLKAILAETHSFLCTEDHKYASLRKQAKSLSEGVVLALAGFMSGKFDISLAAATAAVGFVALALGRIGVGSFCRVTSHIEKPASQKKAS